MTSLPFKTSRALTMGVELELQLLNRRNYNLATDAVDLLEGISSADLKEQIKLEKSMSDEVRDKVLKEINKSADLLEKALDYIK